MFDNLKCYKCHIKIPSSSVDNSFNELLYYLFCKKCIKHIDVCSRLKCKQVFLLTDKDIQHLKLVYLSNSPHHFYIYKDVQDLVIHKYGSLEKLQEIINTKRKQKRISLDKKNENKLNRENEIKYAFMINKLEYKKHGDCYSYIHYGKPDIETIIANELIKNKDKNKRRMELANALSSHDIILDETLKNCYEYIHGLNTENINTVIKNIKIEKDSGDKKNIKDIQFFLSL